MSQADQPRRFYGVSSDDSHPLVNPDSGGGDGGGTDARLRAIEMRLVKVETKLESFATKEDIQKLAATTQMDNQKLAATTREEIQKLAATTREEIQKQATQMAKMESSMLRWFISTVIAIVLLMASLDRLLPW